MKSTPSEHTFTIREDKMSIKPENKNKHPSLKKHEHKKMNEIKVIIRL